MNDLVKRDRPPTEILEEDPYDGMASSLLMASLVVAVGLVMVPALTGQSAFYRTQVYSGAIDPRILYASDIVKSENLVIGSPNTPWVAADFYNDGPGKVYIGINSPGPWAEIYAGEGLSVSMIGAEKRIEEVFYKCDTGKTATVRAVGKY